MSQTTAYNYCSICNTYHEPMTAPCWPKAAGGYTVVFNSQQEIEDIKKRISYLEKRLINDNYPK